jgi:hypothetical protein
MTMLNYKQLLSYSKPIGKYIHGGALYQICLDLNAIWHLANYSNKQIKTELKFLCKNWKQILAYNNLGGDDDLYVPRWREVIKYFVDYFKKEMPVSEEQFNAFLAKNHTRFGKDA